MSNFQNPASLITSPASRRGFIRGGSALSAVAVALLGFLFPIWYGIPLDADATKARLLLDSWR